MSAPSMPDRLFLTGTDTDVGKTVTAAVICAAFGHTYLKPVQAGEPADVDRVAALSQTRAAPSWYRLRGAKSPHRAAAEDGVVISLEGRTAPPDARLLVEGAGGWCVPLGPGLWTADLVRALGLPVVVVCRTTLGTLHHTVSTVRAARADGAEVAGLIAVGPRHDANLADLPLLTGAPLLAWLPWVADVDAQLSELVAAVREGWPR